MKITYERSLKSMIMKRLDQEAGYMVMLWGARQSGKSTLIKQVLKSYSGPSCYISIDEYRASAAFKAFPQLKEIPPEESVCEWVCCYWEEARKVAQTSKKPYVFVIDEVQKLEKWATIVKGMYDRDRFDDHNVQVILLGSSPHLLQKGLSESLMGRYTIIDSPHWSYSEMSQAFGLSLDEYIFYGGYPGGAQFINSDDSAWRNYIMNAVVTNNLERDVFHYIDIEEPEVFETLYYTASENSGRIFNFDKMTKTLQGGRQKVFLRYLKILHRVFMIKGLSLYRGSGQEHNDRGGTVKFQVHNTALTTIRHRENLSKIKENDPTLWGQLVESAVGAHLINTGAFFDAIQYWRDNKTGLEVDFVVTSDHHTVAIEVKSGVIDNPKLARQGLEAFKKRFPQCSRTYLIGNGGDVTVEEFLSKPSTHWCGQVTSALKTQ